MVRLALLIWMLWGAADAAASAAAPRREAAPAAYHTFSVDEAGRAQPGSVASLLGHLRKELRAPSDPVVVLIHGFDTSPEGAADEYARIARRLRRQGAPLRLRPSVIGVYWPSDPGARRSWLTRAAAYRLTRLLGFRKAVRNPYLEKRSLARRAGADGVRSLLLGIRGTFPRSRLHVLTHSLGAEVLLAALAPEAPGNAMRASDPHRTLRVDLAVLAGADLDHDVLSRRSPAAARALDRAAVWWITVPEQRSADGVLELRRAAGRPEAVGNRGLTLPAWEMEALLRRRALVLDEEGVPPDHSLRDYYGSERVRRLALGMCYLQSPAAPEARGSVLAELDRVLTSAAEHLEELAGSKNRSVRTYARWRLRSVSAGPAAAVASSREEYAAPRAGAQGN